MNIRQQLVNCLEYAQSIEQLGDAISQWQQQLVLMQNGENRCDDRISLFRKICLIATGFAVLFIGVGTAMYGLGDILRLLQMMVSISDSTGILTWLVIAVIACSGFFWLRSARKLRGLRAENQTRRQQINGTIQELQERLRTLVEYAREEGIFDIVPVDYFSSDMLEYCISVIDRRLATTMQEAFLLLERELERQDQMAQQQLLYNAQVEQMERLTNAVNVNTMVTLLNNRE